MLKNDLPSIVRLLWAETEKICTQWEHVSENCSSEVEDNVLQADICFVFKFSEV